MVMPQILVAAAAALALLAQSDDAPAPTDTDLQSVDVPAATEPAAPAEPAKPAKPFSLARTGVDRKGKSPYAADMRLAAPPKVYVIPIEGQMGTDIHGEINGKPGIYEKVIADVREQKPDILVFRINSGDDRNPDKYMEAVRAQMKEDKIDPRRLASGLTEYRDLALRPGDMLAVLSAGAYGMAMASNYNTRPRAAEVMIVDGAPVLIRPRETVAELFQAERLLP